MEKLRVGVLALTDSAPFVVALRAGYFEEAGLDVTLEHQPSWATLRDKLIFGHLDAAQMLSPMPVAIEMGLSGTPRAEMLVPTVLSQGGNSVVVSNALLEIMHSLPSGQTLGGVLRRELAQGQPKREVGTVFPFSMHTLQIRRWLRAQDVDPDQDVRFLVVPPARMVEALKEGGIDLFCVGEPWGSVAEDEQLGRIVGTSQTLWSRVPEKVLGFTKAWAQANPESCAALVGAVNKACDWLQKGPDQRLSAAKWLSEMEYVTVPVALLERALLVGFESLGHDSLVPALEFGVSSLGDSKDSILMMVEETLSFAGAGPEKAMDEATMESVYSW